MPPEVINAMREIVNYLYSDEKKDWQALNRPKHGHIFNYVEQVSDWLDESTLG